MDGYMDVSADGFAGRLDVIEGRSGRRRWSDDEKERIASESCRPGVQVADVARWHCTTRWQIYDWRKRLAKGLLTLPSEVGPASAFATVVEPEEKCAVPTPPSGAGVIELALNYAPGRGAVHTLKFLDGYRGRPSGGLRNKAPQKSQCKPRFSFTFRVKSSDGLLTFEAFWRSKLTRCEHVC